MIIAIVGLAAIGGLVATVRDRDWTLVIYGVPVLVGCGLVVALGSGWLAAKALTVASPVPVLAAFIGAAALLRSGRRLESRGARRGDLGRRAVVECARLRRRRAGPAHSF